MTVKKLAAGFALLVISLAITEFAVADDTQASRYITISNAPSQADHYELSNMVQETFSPDVVTVGEAMNQVLSTSAYRLLPPSKDDPLEIDLYSKPLPSYLISIGPETLQNALVQLSGNVYWLIVDPVHRLVTFKVRKNYQSL